MPVGAYLMAFGAMTFAALAALTVFYTVDHLDSGENSEPLPAAQAADPARERIAV